MYDVPNIRIYCTYMYEMRKPLIPFKMFRPSKRVEKCYDIPFVWLQTTPASFCGGTNGAGNGKNTGNAANPYNWLDKLVS